MKKLISLIGCLLATSITSSSLAGSSAPCDFTYSNGDSHLFQPSHSSNFGACVYADYAGYCTVTTLDQGPSSLQTWTVTMKHPDPVVVEQAITSVGQKIKIAGGTIYLSYIDPDTQPHPFTLKCTWKN